MMLWPVADAHQTGFQETGFSQALDDLSMRQQRHAVAPDGSPAFHDDERAAGDLRKRGQGLDGSDGRGDGME
jgi:hypothetical protein